MNGGASDQGSDGVWRVRHAPWPQKGDRLLCELLLAFQGTARLDFRRDILAEMGSSELSPGIDADVPELADARGHIREIVGTIGARTDPQAALESLSEALATRAPYDAALPWLQLAAFALTRTVPLPIAELLRIIRLLHTLTPLSPEQLRCHLPEGVTGLNLLRSLPRPTLPQILQRLLDRRDARDAGPVLWFLGALAADPALAAHPGIDELHRLLGRLGAPGPAAGPADRLIVQIRLDPEAPEHLDNGRYLLRASYYRQPLSGGPFERISTLGSSESLAKDELIGAGSARLAGWADLLGALRTAAGRPVRIEFLLPGSLLGHAAELWSPGRSGQPLGRHCPVVVRSLDRYADPFLDPGPWRERWSHLAARVCDAADGWTGDDTPTAEPDALDEIGWPPLAPDRAAGLADWLASRPTVACVGLDTPYDELDPTARLAVDDAIFVEGVPVLLWRRIAGDPSDLVKALREHHPSSLAQLPETVHHYRRRTRASAGHDGVTLLWDDPYCVDPDQDTPYPGMV
jgi:hypothetical protein